MKTNTLETFHFDPVKSGHILRSFIEDSDLSIAHIAKTIGITYDSLNNSLCGRVQSLSLEKAFKICVATGRSMEEYLRLMMENEPVDFADRIVWHAEPTAPNTNRLVSDATPSARACPAMDYFVDQIALAQERTMDRYKGIHASYTEQLVNQQKDELKLLDDRYNKSVAHLKNQIKKLERKNSVLIGALVLENLAIAGVLLFDALNRNVGWFRSYLNLSNIYNIKS